MRVNVVPHRAGSASSASTSARSDARAPGPMIGSIRGVSDAANWSGSRRYGWPGGRTSTWASSVDSMPRSTRWSRSERPASKSPQPTRKASRIRLIRRSAAGAGVEVPGRRVGVFEHEPAAGSDQAPVARELLGGAPDRGQLEPSMDEVERVSRQGAREEVILDEPDVGQCLRRHEPAGRGEQVTVDVGPHRPATARSWISLRSATRASWLSTLRSRSRTASRAVSVTPHAAPPARRTTSRVTSTRSRTVCRRAGSPRSRSAASTSPGSFASGCRGNRNVPSRGFPGARIRQDRVRSWPASS